MSVGQEPCLKPQTVAVRQKTEWQRQAAKTTAEGDKL